MTDISIFEEFFTLSECRKLLSLSSRARLVESPMPQGVRKYAKHVNELHSSDVDLVDAIKLADDRIKDKVAELHGDVSYDDPAIFYRYETGHFFRPHTDAQLIGNDGPDGVFKAIRYRNCDVSSILYLNEGYEGGEINFPILGTTIKPQIGMLLVFPSGWRHIHSVSRITRGVRYSLANFYATATPLVPELEFFSDQAYFDAIMENPSNN